MEIYKKIADAIDLIKASDLKKAGYNDYSNYAYYTPEQVNKLVYDACKELDLFIKFDLFRTELGIEGKLLVINLSEVGEQVNYIMASDIPQITATNISQQLGGSMTYTKRYMLMNVFDIVDNTLDFDTPQKKTQQKKESTITEWLSEKQYAVSLLATKTHIKAVLKTYDGSGTKGMKKTYKAELEKLIK